MKDFSKIYSGIQDLIYNDPAKEENFNPFNIDWETLETTCIISAHDKEVILDSEFYTTTGVISCGEIVQIYDIELKY